MRKFICKECKTVWYSSVEWKVCPDCKGELEEAV